ncbi:hypothetical protein FC676_22565 [Bacillus cereus]|nr:hypothetical protein FC676_22565 [Bacillus cereus]
MIYKTTISTIVMCRIVILC